MADNGLLGRPDRPPGSLFFRLINRLSIGAGDGHQDAVVAKRSRALKGSALRLVFDCKPVPTFGSRAR
jgi:hypothetical protein